MKKCLLNCTANEVALAREKFVAMTKNDQRQWISDRLVESGSQTAGGFSAKYFVAGKEVCKNGYCSVYRKDLTE